MAPTIIPPKSTAPKSADITRQKVRHQLGFEDWLMRLMIVLGGLWLLVFVVLPLYEMISRSFLDKDGNFVGLANYQKYFSTPSLASSFSNSLYVSLITMLITVILTFIFAYALTRTAMRGKGIFRMIAMLPLYAPSLLHAIAFIYLFGNQGLVTTGLFGYFAENWGFDPGFSIGLYKSPTGIILAELFYLFPHSLIILTISLRLADARLYEAAISLGASNVRTFFTVTLPSVKYGLISACFVCFTLVMTDFGIPKVLGGSYNVLATDIYKQVIGQQNFVMGATVSVLLLTPTVIGFIIDRVAQRQQVSQLTVRAVPLQPKPHKVIDRLSFIYCSLVVVAILTVLGVALFASLIKVWPYDFSMSLNHYSFKRVAGGGLKTYWTSLRMATYTAFFGTIIVFVSAYFIEKGRGLTRSRAVLYFLSTLPIAMPGLVLGLAYIFFFNNPRNPLNFIYNTMAILVLSTIVHFYTVSFFTAMAALKQIDKEFESVSASLKVPFYKTFMRVIVPISLPAILEIAMYLFVNAMTTVSAVIFLSAADLRLAAVAVVSMDDAGDTAPAAAMSILIFLTGIGVRIMYEFVTRGLRTRTQAWTKR